MSTHSDKSACRIASWLTAALVGLLVVWAIFGSVSFWVAVLVWAALTVILAMVLSRLCSVREAVSGTAVTPPAPGTRSGSVVATQAERDAVAAARAAGMPAPGDGADAAAGDSDGEDAAQTPDFDGDGVREGTAGGTRPAALRGPRGGTADDLKQIKGVGPKMEVMLNEMGFYHFDQIAGWSADEEAWVNANLKGFKGRVTRDNWVEQAGILAAGGETEFSKRVEDGDVY